MNVLTTFKISEYVFADNLVLLNHATNQLLVLNSSAQLVWKWYSQRYSDKQIIQKMADFYGIPQSVAENDLEILRENWRSYGLLANRTENKTPLTPKDNTIVSTQSFNTQRTYLLANTPFSLRFKDKNVLANHIHCLFAHLEVHNKQPLRHFELIRIAGKHILLANGEELFCDSSFINVKGHLIQEILKLSYPDTEWLAMIHAMAVAYGQKAVVMPAPSGYGKTTLSAALLKAGFSYLSDDMVPIKRGSHQITPLPTSLSIKKGSWQLLDSHYPELNKLLVYNKGNRQVRYLNPSRYIKTTNHLPVSALVFPQYQAGQRATLEPISKIESLQRLIKNEVWLGNPIKNDIVSEFLAWLNNIPCFSFYYSELEPAVQKIRTLLST
ncbi:hypothetical protein PN36_16210 [Candidatus Thiomargarita nelsonii]|uniref:HPr kinase n=1 Tax=Candidatus Thiomargarita nelsonii TaxID=1003181 RepID=A0A0A6PBX5_9GAMM|nr:hypothetical protein PN36_16210 [Candidatus Thiomargarita nelsonii]